VEKFSFDTQKATDPGPVMWFSSKNLMEELMEFYGFYGSSKTPGLHISYKLHL